MNKQATKDSYFEHTAGSYGPFLQSYIPEYEVLPVDTVRESSKYLHDIS